LIFSDVDCAVEDSSEVTDAVKTIYSALAYRAAHPDSWTDCVCEYVFKAY